MKIRTLASVAVLASASILTTNALAQTHRDSFTYQGSFMDNGEPANGFYDISFIVFDSAVGGSIVLGGATQVPNVEVVDGVFEAFVDFGVTGFVFDSDQTRWLQINMREVGDPFFTALSPRQRMAPTPLANYALRSGTSLQDAYDNGGSIFTNSTDPVEIRTTSSFAAQLNLGTSLGGEQEGRFYMYSPTGGSMFLAEQNVSLGGGSYIQAARNDIGSSGFVIDGNSFGTESTRVSIIGSNSIVLTAADPGDDSVQVPNNAINSTEILNEAGVAENQNILTVTLTNANATIDVIASVTIDCPTAGYVFVIASSELQATHVAGANTSINLGVSSNMAAIPGNGDLETLISLNAPSGQYDHAITVHSVFSAVAGPNTFYFLGDKNNVGGGAFVIDSQLSAIYIPTAYGTVARNTGPTTHDDFAQISAPMSGLDVLREQDESHRANIARQQLEIDAMKAQMQQILEDTQRALEEQQSQD